MCIISVQSEWTIDVRSFNLALVFVLNPAALPQSPRLRDPLQALPTSASLVCIAATYPLCFSSFSSSSSSSSSVPHLLSQSSDSEHGSLVHLLAVGFEALSLALPSGQTRLFPLCCHFHSTLQRERPHRGVSRQVPSTSPRRNPHHALVCQLLPFELVDWTPARRAC